MWWVGTIGMAIATVPLVVAVVHLRHLQRRAAAQPEMAGEWAGLMRELRANLDVSMSSRGRIAACNDASSTVEEWLNYGLGRRSGWRISATSGIAAGCAMLSTTVWGAVNCFVWGALCAAVTASLGQRADCVASQIRERWNGLIRSMARSFPDETVRVETM